MGGVGRAGHGGWGCCGGFLCVEGVGRVECLFFGGCGWGWGGGYGVMIVPFFVLFFFSFFGGEGGALVFEGMGK